MHDLDRTMAEFETGLEEWETDGSEFEFDGQFELTEEIDQESPFTESEEMDLATELLSVTNDAELDQFLGKLVKKAWRGIRKIAPRILRPLGGVLRRVAKTALPIAGRALGTFFGGPAGGAIGGQLASSAGRLFGLELEGLSQEDQEFEIARQFVRFAGTAARNAAGAAPTVPAETAAKAAVAAAARRHAPGLLRGSADSLTSVYGGTRHTGRWIRRGRKIILLGV